jgi:hypothetical protein
MKPGNYPAHPASYRDPAGFVFQKDGSYYRQVNKQFADSYDLLMRSGLYEQLTAHRLLLTHTEVPEPVADETLWYRTLLPEQVPLVSYACEWCFDQLKDAALLTLDLARTGISKGMVLKDATPYNVQFLGTTPVWIDTLSFEPYQETGHWIAYRQFCTQFLFPLYLSHYTSMQVHEIYKAYPEGISAEIVSTLLPFKSKLSLGVWMNVFLQRSKALGKNEKQIPPFSKQKMLNLLQHLTEEVTRLQQYSSSSDWSHYYEDSQLGQTYFSEKKAAVQNLLQNLPVGNCLDAGANEGHFSALVSGTAKLLVAADNDAVSIAKCYRSCRKEGIQLLPLVLDITNPSPAAGLDNNERQAFFDRIQFDTVLALALVHHLAIGRNIPLHLIAKMFARISKNLLIEWVPKEDQKVRHMLASRSDIFDQYDQQQFEKEFSSLFIISEKIEIGDTGRILYLMEKR